MPGDWQRGQSEDLDVMHTISIGDYMWTADFLPDNGASSTSNGCFGDMTALHHAAERGDAGALSEMIANGDSPDIFSSCGTPLHVAARCGHIGCIDALLRAGAHIDALCPDGLTPVLSAAMAGSSEAVSALVARGADLSLAFLPGTHTNLLHVCAEQDLVAACVTILQSEQGRELARCPDTAFKPLHTAALNSERDSECEILEMLLPFSGVPADVPRQELIREAQRLAQGTSGLLDLDAFNPFTDGALPDSCTPTASTLFDAAARQRSPSERSVRVPARLSFTPTANLDCSPADCSPSSRFDMSPSTPPLKALCSSPSPLGMPSPMGSCSGMQWDVVECPRPFLRVKTHVADPGLSGLSSYHGGTSSQASSASAMMLPRVDGVVSGCGGEFTARLPSYDDCAWPPPAAEGARAPPTLRPGSPHAALPTL